MRTLLKPILRIFLGLLIIVVITVLSVIYIPIWNISVMKWYPLLLAGLCFYLAGMVNIKTKWFFLPLLFISYFVFDIIEVLYYPHLILVILFSLAGLLLSRNEVINKVKLGSVSIMLVVFAVYLFSQPFVIKLKDGVMVDGGPAFYAALWGKPITSTKLPKEVYLDPEGNEVDLSKYKGKQMYVTFWATWCGACKYHQPELDSLKLNNKDKDILFVDISIDKDIEKWKSHLSNNHRDGLQLITKNPSKTRVDYQFSGTPTYVLVSAQGLFRSTYSPEYMGGKELLGDFEAVEQLINE